MALQHAAEHERGGGDRRLERIADKVCEVVRAEPGGSGDLLRVDENESAELLRSGPKRLKLGIVQVAAFDVRADQRALQAEVAHAAAKFAGGTLRSLKGKPRQPDKPVR